jgi:hypothetical protein
LLPKFRSYFLKLFENKSEVAKKSKNIFLTYLCRFGVFSKEFKTKKKEKEKKEKIHLILDQDSTNLKIENPLIKQPIFF